MHILYLNAQEVSVSTVAVSCNGQNDGEITVNIGINQAIETIRLMEAMNNRLLKTIKNPEDSIINLTKLSSGQYIVQLVSKGEVTNLEVMIDEPEKLKANVIVVEKYPDEGECNGIVEVKPSGGNQPYSFVWSKNANESKEDKLKNLCEGTYRCEITDVKNCDTVSATVFLYNEREKND
ncbi:MAG: hypothetical protein JXA77_00625 [Bacteroidales bacterium]|nr:hypothetical protein [Bacteroidales bacterium]MBN2820828.1 hypothetical protein [Bacteroidales bacterium]